MQTITTNRVEFIGGPFDGHRQVVALPEALSDTVALPVNRNVYRILDGLPAIDNMITTTIALYELEVVEGHPRYYFLGSTLPVKPFAKT